MTDESKSLNLEKEVAVELATELRRLANHLVKELQKNAVLPGLSNLAAMRPIQQLLTDELSERVLTKQAEAIEPTSQVIRTDPDISYVGYL